MERLVIPVLSTAAADVIADLAARPELDVVAVAVDVGHGIGLDALRDVALVAGARRCHVVDRLETLASSVCWPALRAGALGVPGEPVLTALSMPVVAEAVAEICRYEHAGSVAVWADGPRDRQRLRALLRDVAPSARAGVGDLGHVPGRNRQSLGAGAARRSERWQPGAAGRRPGRSTFASASNAAIPYR